MPELPEVETMARDLASLRGRSIVSVILNDPSLAAYPSAPALIEQLTGRRVRLISRRAKWLQLWLDKGVLLFHPRMTGRPELTSADTPLAKHVRAQVTFDDGRELRLNDMRRFARLVLLPQADNDSLLGSDGQPFFASYGPEPLEASFTPHVLSARLRGGRPLKSALLDQAVLSGLGNIYADEALYRASLHPLRAAGSLNQDEIDRLYHSIVAVLSEGIAARGASVSDYQAPAGGASMQNLLRVYRRTGADCARCGDVIARFVVGGRGTHICPTCQPAIGPMATSSVNASAAS